MRSRIIRPNFFTSIDMVQLDPWIRILFIGLWCLADREGKLEDRPARIKMEVLPADGFDVDQGLSILHDNGLIQRYTVDSNNYIKVLQFNKHQSIHRNEFKSCIPEPNESLKIDADIGKCPENHPAYTYTHTQTHMVDQSPEVTTKPGVYTSVASDDATVREGGKKKFSEEAKAAAKRLQSLLRSKGQTTFAKDWLLTSYSAAESLLKQHDVGTINQAMDWALNQWACASSITHFKHLAKAIPHFERRQDAPAQQENPHKQKALRLLKAPFIKHIGRAKTKPSSEFHYDESQPTQLKHVSGNYVALGLLESAETESL